MKDAGVDPTTEATLTTVNDIPGEITAVLNGQMDAAFVFEGARNVFASSFADNDLFKDLKVLYLTEGIFLTMLLRSNQNGRCLEKKEIKDVSLNMKDDEEGAEAMSLWGHQGYERSS